MRQKNISLIGLVGVAFLCQTRSAMADEFKEKLSPEQYHVCREAGTESPFSGEFVHHKENGVYSCVACGQELFSSSTKFDSGTGWPSFWSALDKSKVTLHDDGKFFIKRTEVRCARCGSHLGHVFDDGPKPTGQRFCINSICLDFRKK